MTLPGLLKGVAVEWGIQIIAPLPAELRACQ